MSIFDLAGPIFDLSWRQNFIKYGHIKLVPYFHPLTVRSAQKRSLLFNSSHFDQFFPQIVHFGHFDHIWSPFGPWCHSWGTPGSPMSGWIPSSTHPTATKFQPVQYLTYTLFWGTLWHHGIEAPTSLYNKYFTTSYFHYIKKNIDCNFI